MSKRLPRAIQSTLLNARKNNLSRVPSTWMRNAHLNQRSLTLRQLQVPREITDILSFSKSYYSAEAAPPAGSSSKKKKPLSVKKRYGGKRKNEIPKQIHLVQLRNPHEKDTIEEHYESIASRTELTKFKWIQTLKRQLDKGAQSATFWEDTQEFMKRKSIPIHVKDTFWNLIIAPTGNLNSRRQSRKKNRLGPIEVAEKDVEIFRKARDLSVQLPFFWSHTRKQKVMKQLRLNHETLQDYQRTRSQFLASTHQDKSDKQLETEARELAELLQSRLPKPYYKKLVKLFEDYVEGEGDQTAFAPDVGDGEEGEAEGAVGEFDQIPNDVVSQDGSTSLDIQQKTTRVKMLFSHVKTQTNTHVHLVALELGDFFYVSKPDAHISDEDIDTLSSDSRLTTSRKEWDVAKDQFVTAFQAVQSLLVEEHKKETSAQADVKSESGSDTDEADDVENLLSDDEDTVFDDSEESVLATFHDAAASPAEKKLTKAQQIKPRKYIVFDAIPIENWATTDKSESLPAPAVPLSPFDNPAFPSTAPVERLVFVDNLPIDVSENYLMDAYSRCGPIEAIQIFHRRADLDPGRRSDDSRKKIRKPSGSRRRWERPRTPLYAMVLYKDAAGAAKATVDPLRIFGMVLDKHLIRSYRATDMTKLYLEDIAATHDVTSIEFELSQLLHPELYVCLDVGRRQRRVAGQSSCQIKFPNVEAAYWAYTQLSSKLNLLKEGDCALHWMQTPNDAMLYWTRQLNF